MKSCKKCIPVLAIAVVAAAAAGCWNDDVYKKYVGDKGYTTSCIAYCDGADSLEQNRCTAADVGGLWTESARCENPQSGSEIITSQEACEQQHGHWITGYCVINDKTGCKNAGLNWHNLDYKMMDLGNSRYILKTTDAYRCGSFDEIIAGNGNECRTDEVNDFEESMKVGFCPDHASYCVGFGGGDSSENKFAQIKDIGICNSCPQGQILCDGQCVDILHDPKHCGGCGGCQDSETCTNGECKSKCGLYDSASIGFCKTNSGTICVDLASNPKHCGDCNTVCKEDEICEERVCNKACSEKEKTCYCDKNLTNCSEVYTEDAKIYCLNSLGSSTCGITECKGIGIELDSICSEGTSCKIVGNDYRCVCPDELVLHNGKCLNPMSIDSCGVTEDAKELVHCNEASQLCDGKMCKCLQGTFNCNDGCVDLLKDKNNCGQCGKKCNDDEVCQDGICHCPAGLTHCNNSPICISAKNEKDFCGARGECNINDPNSNNYKGEKCSYNFICNDDGHCVCPSPLVLCNGDCIDPNVDSTYCGAHDSCSEQDGTAGANCKKIHSEASCIDGECKCDGKLLKVIDGVPDCVDVTKDPRCCGGNSIEDCSKFACDVSAGEVCRNGNCSKLGCEDDKINCQGLCLSANDNVMADANNSNMCLCRNDEYGEWCDDNDNPNDGCYGGKIGTLDNCSKCGDKCLDGYTGCIMKSTGAECGCSDESVVCKYKTKDDTDYVICTDLNNTELHMTNCGVCETNWGNLDGDWYNGCEENLSSNIEHCGTVETNCYEQVKNVNPSLVKCENGVCDYVMCNAGYDDCDDDRSNGCGESIIDNVSHCGTCQNSCKTYQKCLSESQSEMSRQYCCFENGTGCDDCTINIDSCCKDRGLRLWRECTKGLFGECYCKLLIKDNYMCSVEKPGKCWKEVTSD